ncbi:FeoC-like transcriptional regulator [Propionicimonas paludicola]|uniref:FeoC-like transcriptional regulator n=2 Tax=Propionicimonas paludicola TaxID=185243 RepID=A0A2A9CNB8_9ACTN|nr:FeoC-like transcriptional regulator [Propionicimonas paludicola]
MAEVAAGTSSVPEMARHQGLDEAVVRAALDHLVRAGRITRAALGSECGPEGCSSCPLVDGCGAAGPRLISLTLAR